MIDRKTLCCFLFMFQKGKPYEMMGDTAVETRIRTAAAVGCEEEEGRIMR